MFEAARVTDPIAHTSALKGFLIGAVIGIALIAAVAFATFTCGFGVALLAGLAAGVGASAILAAGEAWGRSRETPSGQIILGSPNVFTNSLPAAYVEDSTVQCSKHNPTPLVAEGSTNVFINGKAAARKGDAITCGAKIAGGSDNVFIGGGTTRYLEVDDEIPPWLRTAVDWAFALAGLVGGLAGLLKATGGLSRAVLPCAAKFIGGFVLGEAVTRYMTTPATTNRVLSGHVGHPVEVTTGRKILLSQEEIDFIVPSPIPLEIGRFYASNLAHEGTLGRGWVLPWDLRLQARNGQLWYTDAQGRESGFPIVPPGQSAFDPSDQRYLACTQDGRYILYDLSETYYDFGKLDTTTDTIAWLQRIEDLTGQWQSFERDDQGKVLRIRTSGGEDLKLSYLNVKGRLTGVERMGQGQRGQLLKYEYDAEGQLVKVIDPNGQVSRRFAYAEGLMVSHINALEFECRYRWQEIEGQQRVVVCATSEGEQTEFDYDIANRQTRIVDELGRTAQWTYDEHFQVTACTDLDGSRYRFEYTEAGQPKTLHLPGERVVEFGYDEAGRLVSETDPLGRVTKTRYHRNGLRVRELTLPDGSRWQAEYDAIGRLLATNDPIGRTESYEYPEGITPWPTAHVDAKGGRRTMTWNRLGQIASTTDCSGKTTSYLHDVNGLLASTVNALGETVGYERLRTGELIKVTLPDGSTEEFRYDAAGLLVEHRDPIKQVSHWQRNARGQVLQSTDAARRSLRYRYDARGRLTELASDESTTYRFDYDAGDRLRKEVRPDGVERQMAYGAAGNLSSIEMLGSTRPGSPERPRRTTRFERDAMGRLLGQITETATIAYAWDDADRLKQVERTPSKAGAAVGIGANTVRFEYDKAGRLVAEHGADGAVEYTLDELDTVAGLRLPHGPRIDTLTYGSGHVHQIRCGEQVVSDFERDDLHREVLRTQGRLIHRVGYDALGRRTWQSAGTSPEALGPGQGRLWRSYRYHPAGELAQQEDSLRGAIDYRYDPAGHLLEQSRRKDRRDEQFAWDAAGNLLDRIADGSRKSTGKVEGNRLMTWQDIRFEYDPWGNLITKTSGSRQTQRFDFDAEGRLIRVRTDSNRGQIETSFDYDALGRRVGRTDKRKDSPGAAPFVEQLRFVWQGLRLAQEIRTTGVSSYVYSPDAAYTPLARVDAVREDVDTRTGRMAAAPAKGSTRVLHFHTDLIGTPLEVTDEAGELAWAGKHKAWGKVDRQEDLLSMPRAQQPLRYPGQYADDTTGLHYNTFRYYDPDVGRFISQDPIGLAGGDNLYAYAPNSTGWADPSGLYNGEGERELGKFNSFHETKLAPNQFKLTDVEHFRLGNESVYKRAQVDPDFKRMLQTKYPGALEHVKPTQTGRFRGSSPPQMTWHHGDSPGSLKLVDATDHRSFHKVYHPDGNGGRNKWGGGSGCR